MQFWGLLDRIPALPPVVVVPPSDYAQMEHNMDREEAQLVIESQEPGYVVSDYFG